MFLVQYKKNNVAGNSLNDVEHEPVPTRVLNPNASEASNKPEQRSYKTLCTEIILNCNVAKQKSFTSAIFTRMNVLKYSFGLAIYSHGWSEQLI